MKIESEQIKQGRVRRVSKVPFHHSQKALSQGQMADYCTHSFVADSNELLLTIDEIH